MLDVLLRLARIPPSAKLRTRSPFSTL